MMKLKYLFDNRDLAMMLLGNWEFDKDRLELMNYYRISSNAVYPFEVNGSLYFLRFSPEEERSPQTLLAELGFLKYLRVNGYPAVETLFSKKGKELEIVDTPWGKYLAVAFKGVSGKRLDKIELSNETIFGWGKALGQLHKLSKGYNPDEFSRLNWCDQLEWVEQVLSEFPNESDARKELSIINEFLSRVPVNEDNFGLIHYDFETDNVFYNDSLGCYNIIDFDDAVYHWFVMDIEQAMDSMEDSISSERIEEARKLFLDGYRSVIPIKNEMLNYMPVFRRYADLYSYARCLRSIKDKWDNEPEWMMNLRNRLETIMHKRMERFGKEIKF